MAAPTKEQRIARWSAAYEAAHQRPAPKMVFDRNRFRVPSRIGFPAFTGPDLDRASATLENRASAKETRYG